MKRRIETAWLSYRAVVIPAAAPSVQVIESRRAFYAGAQALLGLLLNQLGPESEPTEADLEMMDEIERELKTFARNVEAGVA